MRPDPYKQRQSRRHLARQGGTRATVSGKAGNHKQDTKAHEEEKSLGLSHSSRLNQSQKARGNEHQTEQQYQSTFSRRAITSNWDRYAEEEKGEEEGEGREKKSMEHPMGAGEEEEEYVYDAKEESAALAELVEQLGKRVESSIPSSLSKEQASIQDLLESVNDEGNESIALEYSLLQTTLKNIPLWKRWGEEDELSFLEDEVDEVPWPSKLQVEEEVSGTWMPRVDMKPLSIMHPLSLLDKTPEMSPESTSISIPQCVKIQRGPRLGPAPPPLKLSSPDSLGIGDRKPLDPPSVTPQSPSASNQSQTLPKGGRQHEPTGDVENDKVQGKEAQVVAPLTKKTPSHTSSSSPPKSSLKEEDKEKDKKMEEMEDWLDDLLG